MKASVEDVEDGSYKAESGDSSKTFVVLVAVAVLKILLLEVVEVAVSVVFFLRGCFMRTTHIRGIMTR